MDSSRRIFLERNSLLIAAARAGVAAPFVATTARSAPAASVANTTCGQVRGRTEGGVLVFRGVPYGASTAGANRFMPPRKPEG